jgi:glycogen debranching enzyme
MHFSTREAECELFLSSPNVGFLMLSASGCSLRKWQGLTVGETSVCAGIQWSFGHDANPRPLCEKHWLRTERTAHTITRLWKADCGCLLREVWDWSAKNGNLKASLTSTRSDRCTANADEPRNFQGIPLWTLSPAGFATCGQSHASLAHDPKKPDEITLSSRDALPTIEVLCGFEGTTSASELTPVTWQPLPDASTAWQHTPKDSCRGEESSRAILPTHSFSCSGIGVDAAFVSFCFHLEAKGGTKLSPAPAHYPTTQLRMEMNSKLEQAFANAAVSLNQLIRERDDGQLGLQAGLPWFTQFWTRDLCHSFRAAFLWSGRFEDGEKLIAELWTRSHGSIPNYTTNQTATHNSADALPLLLMSTADVVDFVGWRIPLKNSFGDIERSLRYGCDIFKSPEGLLRHGPADTWMDAQKATHDGQLIACSPRGDRAIEIQAFWVAALSRWATILSHADHQELSAALHQAAAQGLSTIRENYYNSRTENWADTLRPDGSKDEALRPNTLLAFSALADAGLLRELMTEEQLKRYLSMLTDMNLIVPYGVRTLSPETSVRHPLPINKIFAAESAYIHEQKIHFHPFHEFGSRTALEHPDWAYHNGTIWPWLSHSACHLLLLANHAEIAQQLTETLVWHATQGLQGGALPELLDGLSSHSDWSWAKGAPHQAWSEAALVHMVIENWIGLRLKNFGRSLLLNVKHWQTLPDFSLAIELPQGQLLVTKTAHVAQLHLQGKGDFNSINVALLRDKEAARIEKFDLLSNTPLRVNLLLS